MKISFTTVTANIGTHNGFGVAGYGVASSLQRLGHEVPYQDPTAPVELAFCQPTYDEWSGTEAYRIQYTPWESTKLPEGWVEGFKKADEVWTPSPLIANWYEDAGVKNVHVYEHGIDPIWTTARRERKHGEVLNFLHHGEPAFRKGGQEALDAFRHVFGDRTDVHLTFKSWGHSRVRAMEWVPGIGMTNVGAPDEAYPNVSIIRQDVPETGLVSLYKQADVMVYPGWGEGFGLIPLQAMAAGMPTICTTAWAPYANLLVPELRLGSALVNSPWPDVHPGKMFRPDFAELCELYEHTYENYDNLSEHAYQLSFDVERLYDWDTLTEQAFKPIVKMFS